MFENFRHTRIQTYGLDALHYYTVLGLAFDAMLKKIEVELKLITDVDRLLFMEKDIRGRLSQCSNRYGKANNKYMGDQYNAAEPDLYLIYFDINNLCMYLPYGGLNELIHYIFMK